jgi:transcriptional regulator with GAF, ATPase, and Fis domain
MPFIAVNCAAIPETLLESELFGHERGAFTGAHARRIGRFEQAHQGTIFLDEIGDLSPGTQVKLLRVLQEKYLQRVGGNDKVPVDVRVLAATNRDLESAIQEKQFREDLFYRLSGVTITLPPLSQRVEDIPALVKYLLHRSGPELISEPISIQPEAISFLQNQTWPGNIRELDNVIRQSLLLAHGRTIGIDQVREAYQKNRKPLATPDQTMGGYFTELLARAQRNEIEGVRGRMIEEMERELFTRAIQLAQGNQAKAARWLGVTRTTMREKLSHFGVRTMDPNQDKPSSSSSACP